MCWEEAGRGGGFRQDPVQPDHRVNAAGADCIAYFAKVMVSNWRFSAQLRFNLEKGMPQINRFATLLPDNLGALLLPAVQPGCGGMGAPHPSSTSR